MFSNKLYDTAEGLLLIGKKQNVTPEYNINSLEQQRNVSAIYQIRRMFTCVAPPTVIEHFLLLISQIRYSVM